MDWCEALRGAGLCFLGSFLISTGVCLALAELDKGKHQ